MTKTDAATSSLWNAEYLSIPTPFIVFMCDFLSEWNSAMVTPNAHKHSINGSQPVIPHL